MAAFDPRRLLARDPDRLALRRASRVAIAVPLAIVVTGRLPALEKSAIFATFATLAMLAFADFAGPVRKRAEAYLATTAVGIPIVIVGSHLVPSVWMSVGFMFLITLCLGMLGMLRGQVAAAQSTLLLATVLTLTTSSPGEALHASAAWTLGGMVATVAAILLWPAKPGREVTKGLAQVMRAAADAIDARWNSEDQRSIARTQAALDEQVAKVHGLHDGNLLRASGARPGDRSLAELVEEASRLRYFQGVVDVDATAEDQLLHQQSKQLAGVVARALRATAQRLVTRSGELPVAELARARVEHFHALTGWVSQHRGEADIGRIRREVDATFPLRLSSITVELMMQSAGSLTVADVPEAALVPTSHRTVGAQMRAHLSWESPWLRNALRSAVALGLSVLLAKVTELPHSFWIVLGTLSALRFDALGTGRTAWQAFVGTTGGVIAAAVLIEVVGDNTIAWAILTPLTLFIAAYSVGTLSLATAQAGFTVAVISLFSLLAGATLQTAELRIVEVTMGLAVSLMVSAMIWPRGVVATLHQRMAEAVQAAGDFFVAGTGWLADGAGDSRTYESMATRSAVATDRAQEAYDLSIAQRPPATVPLYQWARVANVARHVDFAARLWPVIEQIAREQGDQRVIPVATVGPMMNAAHRVRATLEAAIGVWQTGAAPPPSENVTDDPAEVVAFRAAIDRFLAAPDEWHGRGSDPRGVALIWIADWTALLDSSARALLTDVPAKSG